MADFLQSAGDLTGIGQSAGGGTDVTLIVIFFVIAMFVMVGTAVGTWMLIRWYQYKYKIIIFQRINGQFQETMRKKARILPIGKGSDQVLLLNRPKKLLPMPSIQSGKNTFNYFISDDEEWINFRFSDFDDDRRSAGAQFLDKEMRYARTSLQHLGEERYNAKGFWEKYGGVIAYASLIMITCIGMWLIIDKMVEFQGVSTATMSAAEQVLDKLGGVLGGVDNIATGGSGLEPASLN